MNRRASAALALGFAAGVLIGKELVRHRRRLNADAVLPRAVHGIVGMLDAAHALQERTGQQFMGETAG